MKNNIDPLINNKQILENLKVKFIEDASYSNININFQKFLDCDESFDFILVVNQKIETDFWCHSHSERNSILKEGLAETIEDMNFIIGDEAYDSFIHEDSYSICYEITPKELSKIITIDSIIGYNIQQQDIWNFAFYIPNKSLIKNKNGRWETK